MSALVFLDTETTGLGLEDDIWEFAAIIRNENGQEHRRHLFIEHDRVKCRSLPAKFRDDHYDRYLDHRAVDQRTAAVTISRIFAPVPKPHVIGAVPNFDMERIAILLRRFGYEPHWHHHLIDVENLAVGFLAAQGAKVDLPWDSDEISRHCGVEPPTDTRHTAMGDAEWTMRLYDAINAPRVNLLTLNFGGEK